jgi:hypothetical protein
LIIKSGDDIIVELSQAEMKKAYEGVFEWIMD